MPHFPAGSTALPNHMPNANRQVADGIAGNVQRVAVEVEGRTPEPAERLSFNQPQLTAPSSSHAANLQLAPGNWQPGAASMVGSRPAQDRPCEIKQAAPQDAQGPVGAAALPSAATRVFNLRQLPDPEYQQFKRQFADSCKASLAAQPANLAKVRQAVQRAGQGMKLDESQLKEAVKNILYRTALEGALDQLKAQGMSKHAKRLFWELRENEMRDPWLFDLTERFIEVRATGTLPTWPAQTRPPLSREAFDQQITPELAAFVRARGEDRAKMESAFKVVQINTRASDAQVAVAVDHMFTKVFLNAKRDRQEHTLETSRKLHDLSAAEVAQPWLGALADEYMRLLDAESAALGLSPNER